MHTHFFIKKKSFNRYLAASIILFLLNIVKMMFDLLVLDIFVVTGQILCKCRGFFVALVKIGFYTKKKKKNKIF